MRYTKLYIAVLDEVPAFMVPTLVAHSVLSADRLFSGKSEIYDDWRENSFRKCVVKVNASQFEKIGQLHKMLHFGYENSTCEGRPTCIVVEPVYNDDVPNVLKFANLWKP